MKSLLHISFSRLRLARLSCIIQLRLNRIKFILFHYTSFFRQKTNFALTQIPLPTRRVIKKLKRPSVGLKNVLQNESNQCYQTQAVHNAPLYYESFYLFRIYFTRYTNVVEYLSKSNKLGFYLNHRNHNTLSRFWA